LKEPVGTRNDSPSFRDATGYFDFRPRRGGMGTPFSILKFADTGCDLDLLFFDMASLLSDTQYTLNVSHHICEAMQGLAEKFENFSVLFTSHRLVHVNHNASGPTAY
jgi:hypothetical protein